MMLYLLLEQTAEHRINVTRIHDLLHGKALGELAQQLFIFVPQHLVLVGGDLDIGVVLHLGQNLVGQDLTAAGRIVIPVIAVGGLGGVDIPVGHGVALFDDVLHQFQGAGDDGATGFPGVEKLFLIHFFGAGMVADEDHFDFFVVPVEKQIQQDKKALGNILMGLAHGA